MSVEIETKPEATLYVVISAGYYAANEDLKLALLHLFSMGSAKDHKLIFVFHASADWDFNGMSVTAKALTKIGEFRDKFPVSVIEAARKVADKVEDISDDILIAFDQEQEAKKDAAT